MVLFSKRMLLAGFFGLAGLSVATVASAQQPFHPSTADCPNGVCAVPTSHSHHTHAHRPGEACDDHCDEHQHAFGHCDENCDDHAHAYTATSYQAASANLGMFGTRPSVNQSTPHTWRTQSGSYEFGAAPNYGPRTNMAHTNSQRNSNRHYGDYRTLPTPSHPRQMPSYHQTQQYQPRNWQSSNSLW